MSRQPLLFIGHGNPMNAIENNPFTQALALLGQQIIPRPTAILVISAHWLSEGTWVDSTIQAPLLYDFYGFPRELYHVEYPAPGAPDRAQRIQQLIEGVGVQADRGLDHGAWTILKHLFPNADIPVLQLSIDRTLALSGHVVLARQLSQLRQEGVLIIGSGNVVHNLQYFWGRGETPESIRYPWAAEFDEWVKDRILQRDLDSLVHYETLGQTAHLSVPTTEHYIPLLYIMALTLPDDPVVSPYEEIISSLSMRCVCVG